MSYTNKVQWEILRSLAAPFTGAYQPLLTPAPGLQGPLLFPAYILKLVNASTVLVTISIDGVNDIDVAPANSFWLYDEGKVHTSSHNPAVPKGTQVYIKGTGGTGTVYLVSQYIQQS